MRKDEEGFLYPAIEESQCIDCGACQRVCPYTARRDEEANEFPQTYYAVKASTEVRKKSQSGGAFSAISDRILKNGGTVYGVVFNADFSVSHQRAQTETERNAMRGSKYVQSDMQHMFPLIEEDLSSGRDVLFTGTPCQCAAVRNVFGKESRHLFVCDLVCHGVPSPSVWESFLARQSKKRNGKIQRAVFRNTEKFGWRSHIETLQINGREYDSNIYATLYYRHVAHRPCCYDCAFATLKRISDITIADFWGIEKISPEFETDTMGVSQVLVNTENGEKLFETCKPFVQYEKCDVLDLSKQPLLVHGVSCPSDRDRFWRAFRKKGFSYIERTYSESSIYHSCRRIITSVLKRSGLLESCKRIVKRIQQNHRDR